MSSGSQLTGHETTAVPLFVCCFVCCLKERREQNKHCWLGTFVINHFDNIVPNNNCNVKRVTAIHL